MFQASSFKSDERGVTLAEVIVVVIIIALFSMILISDFPGIQRRFALSRAAYQMAQDLRKVQDLGLSAVQTKDSQGNTIAVKGYGIYLDTSSSTNQYYVIYADVPDGNSADDNHYNDAGIHNCTVNGHIYPYNCCSQDNQAPGNSPVASDCVIQVIDLSKQSSNLYIKSISSGSAGNTSINFSPPDPTTTITNMIGNTIGIVFGLTNDASSTKTVYVNTSGLINVP